ncbi:adenosine deaminase [Kiloniella laminariae]|uniref:Adenine deaminase n=1 Tax=Kiloniella laminariae TaxID=454162 RepID=A0ABT4LLT8_9PROT|nr:adenosine deaminase [Kiloniella laminariae]MCZ4282085.1 adenosine deaminase [Kiloniella laminariae]
MSDLEKFITALPKAELHLHLEGSLEPELMMELATKNNIELPYQTIDEIRKAYDFSNLQDFLDIYYQGMNVLQGEEDFYALTMAYLEKVSGEGVVHAEVFYDPQGHTSRGVPFAEVTNGILRALDDGREKYGVSSELIMSFLRHLSEEEAFATLREAEPWFDGRIIGVGLDSSELGHPPSKFQRVFAAAREMDLLLVAHAGEEGPAAYVREAVELLKVDRLDHGNRTLEDTALTETLAQSGMTFTVCPLSNLKLCGVPDMKEHPLRRMMDAGLKVTVNSDDPAYFGGYMTANFLSVAQPLDLSKEDIAQLCRNSIAGSFLTEEEKSVHIAAIDQVLLHPWNC